MLPETFKEKLSEFAKDTVLNIDNFIFKLERIYVNT